MIDQFGRSIEYLRLSITDRCNLRCQYCMPEAGIEKHAHDAVLRNEECIEIVRVMADLGVKKVRLTGGEPLVRKGLSDLFAGIRAIEGIEEVTLTTNGLLLENQLEDLMAAGLKRLNISIDSLNPETYRKLTRGGELSTVLRGINRAIELGVHPIKINVVIIKGVNDHEIEDFLNAFDPSIEVRFIELMPIGEAATWSIDKFLDLNQLILEREDLEPALDHGNNGPCRYFKHKPTGRYVGIINSISNHFCSTCNRLRVTSDGMLKTCLHDAHEVHLRPYISDSEKLKQMIKEAIDSKPESHQLNQTNSRPISRNMYTIGG